MTIRQQSHDAPVQFDHIIAEFTDFDGTTEPFDIPRSAQNFERELFDYMFLSYLSEGGFNMTRTYDPQNRYMFREVIKFTRGIVDQELQHKTIPTLEVDEWDCPEWGIIVYKV